MNIHMPGFPVRICLAATLFMSSVIIAEGQAVGLFEDHADIGNPKLKGGVAYNTDDQTYVLSGAGKNMWFNTDEFHFAWKKIKGDFIIRATIQFIGKGTADHRKIGIMARDALTNNSRYADACVHGDILSSLQYRSATGDSTGQVVLSSYHPTEIELERSGNVFTFSAATKGENYKSVSKEILLNEEVYAGLFICSHLEDVTEKAVFSNVRIIIPAAKDFRPYRDYIGSNLEIMEMATGLRKTIYTAPNSIQAPNWTIDNRALIFNTEGLLYKYDIASSSVTKLNTGAATENNNDHVLSFDGKMLGISNYRGKERISSIYTLPVTGSDKPTMITSDTAGHSYFHGWSPDGKNLIFTGFRNKQWNIWKINIASRKETALTHEPTLNDGPEYTPDGKYIYFNSARTGTMKIWRMRADGSMQEQITFDEYNDWFPHISPDGKWIVYISFPKEIDPATHPFYKRVYLRLLPVSGGVAKTIAYVYGGQGSINVPSWSPDSKRIAFVSNTKF